MSFPRTLKKLLATREWRGSIVDSWTPGIIRICHPNGHAEMRLTADVFERFAKEDRARELAKEAYRTARDRCNCGALYKTQRPRRHKRRDTGEWHYPERTGTKESDT